MRVTQSMLSNNMLRNLSASYNRLGKLQEQIETGKKVNRPSDDPVVVMKGMGYRMQVDKVHQYQRNLGEVNVWLDNSDEALDKVGLALRRAYELAESGATDTMTPEDREVLQAELAQLREQVRDLANTQVGDKYLFNGTKTSEPLFKDGILQRDPNDPTKGLVGHDATVKISVFDGVKLQVNTNGHDMFKEIDELFDDMAAYTTRDEFDEAITKLQKQMGDVVTTRADIGARQNRSDLMENRLSALEVSATKQMSENEDVEYEKAITEMITEEAIHRATLSVGARIIQPSLVDFLR